MVTVSDPPQPEEITISSDLADTPHPEGATVDVTCDVTDCSPSPPALSLKQNDTVLKTTNTTSLTYQMMVDRNDNNSPLRCCAGGSHVEWSAVCSTVIIPEIACKMILSWN